MTNFPEALRELLVTIKARSANEDAIPVLGDDVAMRVLAAVDKVEHTWAQPRTAAPVDDVARWRWLCAGWTFSRAELAIAAGVTLREASDKVETLIANRLMYPDGTTSRGAKTALRVYIARQLGVRQKAEKDEGDGAKTGRGADAPKTGAPGDTNRRS